MGKLTLNWAKLKPEVKQVWQLSLPAILTQITTIAMQYIDSAMVGALGAAASAAIGLVVAMTWLYNGVLSAVSAGFSVQVAHHIGAGQDSDARNVIRHGLISALSISGLLAFSGLLLSHPLPILLGGDPAICPNATAYFFVYSLMIPFSQLNSLTSAFLQCSGDMDDTKYFKCRHVCTGCSIQCLVYPTLWCPWCRYGNSTRLCHHQSDHDMALLHLQQAAAPQTY